MTAFEKFVALKYISTAKKNSSLSLITIIAILGMAIGVATLLIVLSVMDGFVEKMQHTILKASGDVNIYKLTGDFTEYKNIIKKIKKVKEVTAVTPIVFKEALVSSKNKIHGVLINGIDLKTATKVFRTKEIIKTGDLRCLDNLRFCKFKKQIKKDELKDFLGEKNVQPTPVFIGSNLAEILNVSKGKTLTIISSSGGKTNSGEFKPISKTFVVGGIFETGMYDYDSRFIFMNLKNAQKLFSMDNSVSFISLRVKNPMKMTVADINIINAVGGFPYSVQDWIVMNKTTFKFLKIQKTIMFIILIFIVLVASFGIISSLIMLVITKTHDISVLRSLGASRKSIKRIFVADGMLVGFLGTFLGVILAIFACNILKDIHFSLSKDIYFFDTLPVKMSLKSFLYVALSSLSISFFATLYPSIKASKISPTEGLKYD